MLPPHFPMLRSPKQGPRKMLELWQLNESYKKGNCYESLPLSHAPISPLWTDQHWQPAKNQDWQSLESSISSAKQLNGNERARKKGKKGILQASHSSLQLGNNIPISFFFQSSWNNLAKTGPYICWLSLARWSRYIWGHFLFPFYLVCRDLPDKIQYMGHRSNGFHPETKLSKFNLFSNWSSF